MHDDAGGLSDMDTNSQAGRGSKAKSAGAKRKADSQAPLAGGAAKRRQRLAANSEAFGALPTSYKTVEGVAAADMVRLLALKVASAVPRGLAELLKPLEEARPSLSTAHGIVRLAVKRSVDKVMSVAQAVLDAAYPPSDNESLDGKVQHPEPPPAALRACAAVQLLRVYASRARDVADAHGLHTASVPPWLAVARSLSDEEAGVRQAVSAVLLPLLASVSLPLRFLPLPMLAALDPIAAERRAAKEHLTKVMGWFRKAEKAYRAATAAAAAAAAKKKAAQSGEPAAGSSTPTPAEAAPVEPTHLQVSSDFGFEEWLCILTSIVCRWSIACLGRYTCWPTTRGCLSRPPPPLPWTKSSAAA
jgi:hypothetical protein